MSSIAGKIKSHCGHFIAFTISGDPVVVKIDILVINFHAISEADMVRTLHTLNLTLRTHLHRANFEAKAKNIKEK